jgi:hypothetical protein
MILLLLFAVIIEVNEADKYFRTCLSLDGLDKQGMYETPEGIILVSTKHFKVLPKGFCAIQPTMLIGSQLEDAILNVYYTITSMDKRLFATDCITSLIPIVDIVRAPRIKQPANSIYFASDNPQIKIIMCRKQGKEYYYIK